ncbi:MAG TPA: MogA/MoaB family molybdenum cofactor biosynthesis protein [Chloroflexota bacterium]
MVRVAVLTVSTSGARGERAEDVSGATIREMAAAAGWSVAEHRLVADDRAEIAAALREWAEGDAVDLIVTTGGTGLSPTDVTPEATRDVLEKELPGMAEAMRSASLAKTPRAMLSRAVAGARGRCLIVNLPGSPRGVRECLEAVLPVIGHAVEILQARPTDH